MKIIPTVDKGLRVIPEAPAEWMLLRKIIQDANPTHLADRLSQPMDEESCWEDIVQPELEETFNTQLIRVADATKVESLDGFLIKNEHLMEWYGALNQARLMLENTHSLSTLDLNELDTFPPPLRQALVRASSYTRIQSLILDYLDTSVDETNSPS